MWTVRLGGTMGLHGGMRHTSALPPPAPLHKTQVLFYAVQCVHLLFCDYFPPAAGLLAMSEGHDKATSCKLLLLLLLDNHLAMHVRVAFARVISCAGTSLHTST